jgi:phosphatidylserine synthase
MNNGETYKLSGKFSPAIILGIPIFAALSMIYALIYAYVDIYIPIVGYLSIIFVFAFTVVNMATSSAILRFFKVRNKYVIFLWGTVAAAVAIYFNWACFLQVLLNKSLADGESVGFAEIVFAPDTVWEGVKMVGETGWYSLKSAQIKGGVLWTFWGIEALIILVGHILMAFEMLKEVFCEKCREWAEKKENIFSFEFNDEKRLVEQFTSGDSNFVKEAAELTPDSTSFYKVDASVCSECDGLVYLSLNKCEIKQDKSGETSEANDELVKNIYYSIDEFKKLAENFSLALSSE